ncbi:MAG: putative acyl-CoA dehydrogenase fadE25 [Fimbriimonadaceae bacterium]|nr:putative acyl-CoA dehydrogenase fadE25 [Fimbriimonadaceae bacterium]
MNSYRLNPDQIALVDRLSMLADAQIAPHAAAVDESGRFPTESMQALADGGFWGLNIAPEFGGMGQGLRVVAAALDAVAQRCASTSMVYLMHLCGIAAYNSVPDRTSAQLRAAASGKHLSTLAWSERGSRSHFWAPISQAANDGDFVVLEGIKSWVTSAGHANGYVATTRAAGSDHPMAITLYLVENDDQGFRVESPWNALGMRGNASAPMVMEKLRLSNDRALSEPGKGMDTMMGAVLPTFAIGNSAVAVGCSEAAVTATQSHLVGQKLQHLGQSLADLPNLRDRLARMRLRTDQSRSYLAATLDALDAGDPGAMLWVLGTKAQAAEAALEVTDLGMRTCGGAAFSKHLGLERVFRDARAMSVMAPTSDVLHDFVGKALCGMELF